ncbi:PEP/pyruvate-binding domain-containing protein [Synergistes jonesii]|uniref:Phosphoenolpyruvate synthase n=1 Tax=Synergistes jonesii TaxID=2754 RepID=A0A073IT83_9BACT|nr:PEP/pyruvate-binding domain-containing protein [Synergistes jonesii]KEJ92691.1 pyruvate phosphate dikinase [Synergistes jonesii]
MNYGDFYRSFEPEPFYLERGWMIGGGRIGGKAKGLSFAHHVLEKNGLLEDVHMPEYSFVVTTSAFDEFMELNGLWERLESLREHSDAPELYRICAEASLPPSLEEPLEKILSFIEVPISVRSSSTLEDDVNLSFAGKYATVFSSNAGTKEARRAELESAIKMVYASTYNASAREYKRKHGIKWGGERMAVLIQPIEGRRYGSMFYPEMAGAAFSKVFRRPSPRIRKEDGVARICFGLGTRTVDRAYARTFYLTNPNLRPEGTKPREIVTHSQEHFDYVDLDERKFSSLHISKHVKEVLKKHKMASAYLEWFSENSFHWIHTDRGNLVMPRPVFTFSELPSRCPKLFSRLKALLSLFEEELQLPVDMEFAYEADSDRLTLVQLRPLSVYDDRGRVEIPETPPDEVILRGSRMVANGRLEGARHIVYVDPDIYGKRPDFSDVARAVGDVNDTMKDERYILVGPGRWGSSNPLLGVPVRYNEISNSGCLAELGIPQKGMAPELSYGTHFFLDLDGDNTLYLPVFEGEKGDVFNREWFDGHPWKKTGHPAVRLYEGLFDVLLDGESEVGVVIDRSVGGKGEK